MHLHGHNFFVLAEGQGEWDGKITNYPSTTRRDVHIVQGSLYVNLMEQPGEIRKRSVPQTVVQTCRDWSVYSGNEVVEQIDSGL
ncbi:MAG: hypothetical protein Q9192_008968 [Flavoplaca navasiana]